MINISYLYSVETNAMLELTLKNTEHGALPGNGYGGFCIATIQPPSLGSVIMEIWKDIEGYEGWYQISNYGNIKSVDRIIEYKNGAIRSLKGKILKTTTGTPGYYITDIHKKGNVNRVSIHRLIGIAFIPNPHAKPCINHKDGNKINNHVDNLEWVTYRENLTHAYSMGLSNVCPGENHQNAKLNPLQVRVIRKCDDLCRLELAEIFNVSDTNISKIKSRKTWNHI